MTIFFVAQNVRTLPDLLHGEVAETVCITLPIPLQQYHNQGSHTPSSTSSQERPWIFLVQAMCLPLATIYMEGLTRW